MPTAHEFDQAARQFDRAADEIELLLHSTPHPIDPDVLRGGMLTMLTDITISSSIATARAVADGLRRRADTCRERAEVCRAHADAVALYRMRVDAFADAMDAFDPTDPFTSPPTRPAPPPTPPAWVELSTRAVSGMR